GEILDDADKKVDPAVAAGVAGRADDHRHTEPARGQQHVLAIVDLPLPRTRWNIASERPRPDIARSGSGADQIGLGREAACEARGPDRREAEMPIGAKNAEARVGREVVLDQG